MNRARDNRGYTLVEVMVAVSISTIVLTGMTLVFIWTLETASQCQQYSWAQTEALKSSQRIVSYLRNGGEIMGVDTNGNWVEVAMPPSNFVARFAYENPGEATGAGQMLFVANTAASGPTNVLARGLARPVNSSGKVFEQTGTNGLRMAYQITKPGSSGAYPAALDVGVQLRNN